MRSTHPDSVRAHGPIMMAVDQAVICEDVGPWQGGLDGYLLRRMPVARAKRVSRTGVGVSVVATTWIFPARPGM